MPQTAACTIGLLRCADEAFGIPSDALLEVALVQKLDTILSPDPAVLGAVSLRGTLVPVLDPLVLCGLSRSRAGGPGHRPACAIAAIVTDGRAMVALGVSGIAGLRRCPTEEIQRLGGEADTNALAGHALLEGEIVHILDPARLLARSDLPRAARRPRSKPTDSGGDHAKHLVFEAGGATYALTAEHIFGTVPRQDLAERWLGSGGTTGCLRVQERRVPVVDPGVLFGLGTAGRDGQPEYIVLQMPGDRLVALAADEVCRIQPVPRSRIHGTGDGGAAGSPLLTGTFDWDGRMVFVVDAERLRREPRLAGIAELSDRHPAAGPDAAGPSTGSATDGTERDVIPERVRHIVFHAAGRLAAPIEHVTRIIEPPSELTFSRAAIPGLLGLFPADGLPVPLVDLAAHRGRGQPSLADGCRVLVSQTDAGMVGFVAHAVEGIADSDWRSRPAARLPGGGDLVQLRHNGTPIVLERVELPTIARAILDAWRIPRDADAVSCEGATRAVDFAEA